MNQSLPEPYYHEDFKAQILQNPAVRKEYEALEPQFNLLRLQIAAKEAGKLWRLYQIRLHNLEQKGFEIGLEQGEAEGIRKAEVQRQRRLPSK